MSFAPLARRRAISAGIGSSKDGVVAWKRFWRPAALIPGVASTRLSQRLGYRLQNGWFASSPRPGQTVSTLLHLEAAPTWIRLLYANDGPEPWTVDGAAVAATADVGDRVTPVGPDGLPAPSAWRHLTFQGAGADEPVSFAEAGAVHAMTVPGNAREADRPVHVWSDWAPVTALPRRGRGPGFLVLVRSFSHGHLRFAGSTGGPDRALKRVHASFVADGDALGPDSPAAFVRSDGLSACHGVQFIGPTPGATVLGVGDSIMQSSCTAGQVSGYGVRACALVSSPRRPVSFVNEGFPGRRSIGFCANALWAIEAFRPQVAVIHSWTRNDPWTFEAGEAGLARAIAVADHVRRHGGVPILATAAPSFPQDPGADPPRQATNERVRTLGRSGWPVIDLDAIWGTGRVPNVFRRSHDAGDGFHPNDAASAAAARVLAPMLERMLAHA